MLLTIIDFSTKLGHAGVLTDGCSWEFYVVERVPLTTEDGVEQSENVEEMEEWSGSDEGNSSELVNLYGTGPILVVDKGSASIVFGNPSGFCSLNLHIALLTYFTSGYIPDKNPETAIFISEYVN